MEMNQVYDALRKAHAAGDTASAQRLADFITSQQTPEPTLRQKVMSSAPMRVVQGMRDPIDAAAQIVPRGLQMVTSAGGFLPNPVSEFFGSEAARVDKGISEAEREYDVARMATGQDGADIARLAGNVLSPVNAAIAARIPMAATTGGRVAGGAALGGVGGGLQPINMERNESFAKTKAGQVFLGAGTGAVATPIMGKIGDFISQKIARMGNRPDVITLQKTTEEFANGSGLDWASMGQKQRQDLFETVKRAAQEYAGTDPRIAARIADFKQLETPYTLGQVTRDPMQFSSERNLRQVAGVGDPLLQRMTDQQRILQQRIGNFAAGADESQAAGQRLAEGLRTIDKNMGSEVTKAYKAARASAGKDAEVPMGGLASDVGNIYQQYSQNVLDGLPTKELQSFGLLGGKQTKLFTVEEADKLLKVINSNKSNNPAVNDALSVLRTSVKRAVTEDAGADDVFAPARALAAKRFSLQDAVPALDASASGVANPDTFVQNFLISKSASTPQVKELARVLREKDPEAFQQARSQIGAYIQRQAFGENIAGDKPASPERLAKALRELGSEKLGAFFSPDEVSQIQRISRVSGYIESTPAGAVPNTSGNWGAIMSNQLASFPGVPMTGAIIGALRNSASNQLAVNRALTAQPSAQLTPEQIRMMSQFLTGGTLATGAATAQQIK